MIDSYHDRRTGYEFGVSPVGAKLDLAISNDGNEDDAWDAVWDVATTLDSLGWTAEFRIPLSQLRYPESPSHTFGLMLMRDIYRYTERVSWPLLRRSRSGFPSQFGEVTGLDGLGSPRRLEVAPYVVTKNVSLPTAAAFDRSQKVTAGANIKYGVTSNLTLDGTVNPDFGQVEADPAVLNLSAFETFFQERRPFFVEGAGIFRFDVGCSAGNCNGEGLFYSRRILHAPQRLCRSARHAPSIRPRDLRGLRLAGREPRGGDGTGDRGNAARRGTLLPAPRCRAPLRLDAYVAHRRRRRGALREGRREAHEFRDELSAPVAGLRGQRSRLLAARGPAELEQLVRLALQQPDALLSARQLELQLVAVLDRRRPAAGAGREHQHAHPVEQPLVGARRRHDRSARRHVLRSLRPRRTRGAPGSLHRAVVRAPGGRPPRVRAEPFLQLLEGRCGALPIRQPERHRRYQGTVAVPPVARVQRHSHHH